MQNFFFDYIYFRCCAVVVYAGQLTHAGGVPTTGVQALNFIKDYLCNPALPDKLLCKIMRKHIEMVNTSDTGAGLVVLAVYSQTRKDVHFFESMPLIPDSFPWVKITK